MGGELTGVKSGRRKNQGRCLGFWKAGPTGGATSPRAHLRTLAHLAARATAEENADKSEAREGIRKA